MVTALPFGARAQKAGQTRVLRAALAAIHPDRPIAAFDLDSTILVNRVRQARIVREFGRLRGDARLCGLSQSEIEAVVPHVRDFWRDRFFTSEYCKDDTPAPGARDYLRAVVAAGGEILYITGRHQQMGPGTLESFRRAGFPLPGGDRVQLWLKPALADDDDRWKEICHARLQQLRGLACAFDNEPTHVNAYKRSFPDAVVVHLDTDHSRRPVEVHPDVPSIHDFVMEPGE